MEVSGPPSQVTEWKKTHAFKGNLRSEGNQVPDGPLWELRLKGRRAVPTKTTAERESPNSEERRDKKSRAEENQEHSMGVSTDYERTVSRRKASKKDGRNQKHG